MYDKEFIKLAQRKLGLNDDGVVGPNTMAALAAIPGVPNDWPQKRQVIGYIQWLCTRDGINPGPIDGYMGPQTEYAAEQLKAKESSDDDGLWGKLFNWRDDEGADLVVPTTSWPASNQEALTQYYGGVGSNQTKVTVPYPLRIAWQKTKKVTRFSCHEKVADSMVRVLERVQDHYGDQISELGLDLWGGCLNVRKMRGGTKWSTHSWGIALDWDPERNRLRWKKDKANFAKPEYDVWWKLWEEEGWVSLGRARNYDWMHVQAAKVK